MPGNVTSSQRTTISLRVNGVERALEVEPRRTLLDALREDLGLTGAKPGCEMGELRRLDRLAGWRGDL